MWRSLGLDLVLGTVVVAAWYFVALHLNRRRSLQILYWIDDAIQGVARISGFEWESASRFLVRLRFPEHQFKGAVLRVNLFPWELPLSWLKHRLRKSRETVTFEADLPVPPSFNMQVEEQRWLKPLQNRKADMSRVATHKVGPIVLTTRPEWPPNVVNLMESVYEHRHCNILQVTFDPKTPNFTATLPLECLRPGADERMTIFNTMRELATGASTPRT